MKRPVNFTVDLSKYGFSTTFKNNCQDLRVGTKICNGILYRHIVPVDPVISSAMLLSLVGKLGPHALLGHSPLGKQTIISLPSGPHALLGHLPLGKQSYNLHVVA